MQMSNANVQIQYRKCSTRNALVYIVTNLMYTPRALFSCLFLQICSFILSLYTAGRQLSSLASLVTSHYSVQGQSMVSVYIHKVNRIGLMHLQRHSRLIFVSKWPLAAILDLVQLEIAQFDAPSRKTPP